MKYRATLLGVLVAVGAFCQAKPSTNSAATQGFCSPAVSGQNNQITITCHGVDREGSDRLIRLLNSILRQQLDPKVVYSKLDEIQSMVEVLRRDQAQSIPVSRRLTDEQKSILVKFWSLYPGHTIDIWCPMDDPEAKDLGMDLAGTFRAAGWKGVEGRGTTLAMYDSGDPVGIEILVNDGDVSSNTVPVEADWVRQGFGEINLPFRGIRSQDVERGKVRIIVGRKP